MTREPLVDVDLGENGGRVRFYSIEDANEFLEKERGFWAEVIGGAQLGAFNMANSTLNELQNAFQRFQNDPSRNWLDEGLRRAFLEQQLPHSNSTRAQAILQISTDVGAEAADAALAVTVNSNSVNMSSSVMRSRESLRGAILMFASTEGLSRASSAAAAKSLAGYASRREAALAKDRDDMDAFLALHNQELAEYENEIRDTVRDMTADYEARFAALGADNLDAVKKILATDAQFREQMHLQAPSEYWSDKAARHKSSAKKLRNWIVASVVIGGGAYLFVAICNFAAIKAFLLEFQGSSSALLIITGGLAFALAIPLWFLRILVKFYLSEQHLAVDASERHIMVLTYLALTTDKTMADQDRLVILNAIFRTGQDGLVKDNTGPDASLAGVISRLLESK